MIDTLYRDCVRINATQYLCRLKLINSLFLRLIIDQSVKRLWQCNHHPREHEFNRQQSVVPSMLASMLPSSAFYPPAQQITPNMLYTWDTRHTEFWGQHFFYHLGFGLGAGPILHLGSSPPMRLKGTRARLNQATETDSCIGEIERYTQEPEYSVRYILRLPGVTNPIFHILCSRTDISSCPKEAYQSPHDTVYTDESI